MNRISRILSVYGLASCLAAATAAEAQNPTDKLAAIEKTAQAGPFQPNWDSLAKYQIPEWYQDAKFGIFIHWGAYSVPGYGSEWYPREMYLPDEKSKPVHDHHAANFGSLTDFGYKDFIPKFKAERFNATAWAKLFKEAGAKYVIPVAEHHDGFPMYDSQYTDWNAAKMGPKRDVIGELSQAIRQEGLIFGLSNHRVENWWFYGGGRKIPSDVQDERYRALYGPARDRQESEDGKTPPDDAFLQDWLKRACEQVDKYHPQVIWFDWWIAQPAVQPYLKTFSSYYYNQAAQRNQGVAINYKKLGGESFPDTAGVLDIERGQLSETRKLLWQTDTSVSRTSWGYVTNQDYKSVNSLVDDLVDIVSKNGCLLLNIGPKPDGTIPDEEQRMLRQIGAWLKINGEAIYGTRPWVKFGEGSTQVADGTLKNDAEKQRSDFGAQDIRFTAKGNTLYAIFLDWPGAGKSVKVRSFSGSAMPASSATVTLLGHEGNLDWSSKDGEFTVVLPQKAPCDYAVVLKISDTKLSASR